MTEDYSGMYDDADGEYYDDRSYPVYEDEYYNAPQDFEAQGGYYEDEDPLQDFEGAYYEENPQQYEDSYYEDEPQEYEDSYYEEDAQEYEDSYYENEPLEYEEESEPQEDFEIDPRFNLGGVRNNEFSAHGSAFDTSPDAHYEGNVQTAYAELDPPKEEIPELPDGYIEEKEESQDEENPEFKGSVFKKEKKASKFKEKLKNKKSKKKSKKEESFDDSAVSEDEADYASSFSDGESIDYAAQDDYSEPASHLEPEDDFPSFKEYLLGLLTGVIYKLKNPGVIEGAALTDDEGSTMPDSDEDLGRERSPQDASKYYGSFVHSLKIRTYISLVLLAIMAYISLGLPLGGMLKTVKLQAISCIALQLGITIMCLDVFTGAVMNAFRGRFGVDFMAVILCLITFFDGLSVGFGAFGDPHVPLCLLSSLSLVGVLISALFHAKGMRKAIRVPAIAKSSYSVTGKKGVKGSGVTLIKTARPAAGFVHRSEESSPDETAFNKFSPFMLVIALVFALIVCTAKHAWSNFLFVFSACLVPAVPFTGLMCFALPFFIGSARIFSSGAAIAGWSGLCDIGTSKNLIVTDRDLFPQGSVSIDNIRIFADLPSNKIISYAGTMLGASGCGIASCFGELMEKNNCSPKRVENFECLAGGGFKGIIDSETVLCGGLEFMRLMNVHVPYKLIDQCSVLLAVDNVLYGIFNLKYTADPKVKKALKGLMKSNRHPIFAVRDFNITPDMLEKNFEIPTAGYDFPPFTERFEISDAKPDSKAPVAALVCREGLGPLIHMADTGRSMYIAARVNIMLCLLSCAVGMLTVLIKLLSLGFVSPGFLLGYAVIWAIPMFILSVFLKF